MLLSCFDFYLNYINPGEKVQVLQEKENEYQVVTGSLLIGNELNLPRVDREVRGNKIMDKLMAGTLEVGGITITSVTTLNSFRNENLNIKIKEGNSNNFVHFLSPQSIYSESFLIQLVFIDEKISKVIPSAYSEIEEDGLTIAKRHRKWLITLLGEQLGIKNQIEFDWGVINPWVDMRSSQAEIHLTYF